MLVGHLSESLEDYLEVIFRLLQKQKVARVRDIARIKGVKTSSAISALQRLAKEGLVDYRAREFVDLTETGRPLAFRLYQRHTFLKRFLTDLLQVDPETAERDACSMEHAISVTTLDRVAAMSEFLSYCPNVDRGLIDTFRDRWLTHLNEAADAIANGHICGSEDADGHTEEFRVLAKMRRGESGYIAHIAASDEMRHPLIQRGVLPGASVQMLGRVNDNAFEVRVAGEQVRLTRKEASCIQVGPQGTMPHPGENGDDDSPRRTLADMTPGRSFKVAKITAGGEIRQRMIDMGFIRGAEGRILREALLRDPIEVELGGTLLSLRRVEATGVIVEELDA